MLEVKYFPYFIGARSKVWESMMKMTNR